MRIKSILLSIAIVSIAQTIRAQTFEWAKQFSGTGTDNVFAKSITTDALGNVYTTGSFFGTVDFNPGVGINNLTGGGVFISKLDAAGNFIWVKQITSTFASSGNSITIDNAGNVYTTGNFAGTGDFDPGPGTFNLSSGFAPDIFISKLDASGNFVWAKQIGVTSGTEIGRSITTDAAGNVYTTGDFAGTVDFDPGAGTNNLTSAGLEDIFISKLDPAGNFVWAKQIGGTNTDIGKSIAIDAGGNVYTTGVFRATADFDPGPGINNISAFAGSEDIFISKLDASGNFVWAKQFGGTGMLESGNSIAIDATGNVYTTGTFFTTADFDPGPGISNLTSVGSTDIFISKLDPAGNFVWAKQIGGTNGDAGNAIAVDAAGSIYTTGVFRATADFDPGTGTNNLITLGNVDVFISKLDQSGNFVWAEQIGGTDLERGISINIDASANVYIAGEFNGTADFDPGAGTSNLTPGGNYDAFVHKMSQCFNTTGTDVQTACESYTWIDGNTYFASNNTATWTLTNAAGCDSIVTLDLTINNSNTGTDVQTVCDSYTWIDGNTYTASNNTATWTLTNASGCDSIVTLDLTINNSNTGTDVQTACDSYTWIDGNTYTASNNTATFTLTNAAGCDSIVTLDLTINNSNTGTDVQTACDSYTWIDGNTYTASNNTATWTLTNAAGCDSIVTLDLTINNSNTGTDVQTACDSYTWIDGNTYTASNNTATFTLTNAAGCDSIVTLDLTINNSNTGTDVITACDSYTWIDGNTYTASNNSATFNIIGGAANGCDSLVTLDLTIINSTTGTDTRTECNSYTWIDGNTYTASNNSATFNIIGGAANGCDSLVTLDLTINNSNTGTDVQTACDSYTWIDGNTYTASNNTATWTLTNAVGCDSTVTLDLTINNSNTGTDVQTACDSYTWIDGNTYTASNNTATWTLTNAAGCDSIVTLDLTIDTVDVSTTQNGTELSANLAGASAYQWVDCDNGNQPITGETNQILNVTANGSYAVVVTNGNCSDTSDCMLVDYIGIKEQMLHDDLTLYPNPSADGLININFDGQIRSILVMDLSGREVKVSTHLEKKMILGSDLSPGRYIVRLETDSGWIIKELVIVR